MSTSYLWGRERCSLKRWVFSLRLNVDNVSAVLTSTGRSHSTQRGARTESSTLIDDQNHIVFQVSFLKMLTESLQWCGDCSVDLFPYSRVAIALFQGLNSLDEDDPNVLLAIQLSLQESGLVMGGETQEIFSNEASVGAIGTSLPSRLDPVLHSVEVPRAALSSSELLELGESLMRLGNITSHYAPEPFDNLHPFGESPGGIFLLPPATRTRPATNPPPPPTPTCWATSWPGSTTSTPRASRSSRPLPRTHTRTGRRSPPRRRRRTARTGGTRCHPAPRRRRRRGSPSWSRRARSPPRASWTQSPETGRRTATLIQVNLAPWNASPVPTSKRIVPSGRTKSTWFEGPLVRLRQHLNKNEVFRVAQWFLEE